MKKIEDERIIIEKRKINSHAFSIFYIGLWLILIYRQFVLGQSISQYWDIFVLTLGGSFFVLVNNMLKGMYLTYRKKREKNKAIMMGAIVGTITFTLVNSFVIGNGFSNSKDIITTIVSAVIFFVVWMAAQSLIIRKSEKRADEEIEK